MHSINGKGNTTPSIAIDMDGVLADVYAQFAKFHFEETGEHIPLESIAGVPEFDAFPLLDKHIHRDGFFRETPLMPSAQRVLERLNDAYQIYIVSAAMEYPKSLLEKYDWLKEHFPYITWRQIIFCGSKYPIHTHIMIDDHFKNLDVFQGEKTFLFTQPHNSQAEPGKHQRIDGWDDLEKILL